MDSVECQEGRKRGEGGREHAQASQGLRSTGQVALDLDLSRPEGARGKQGRTALLTLSERLPFLPWDRLA